VPPFSRQDSAEVFQQFAGELHGTIAAQQNVRLLVAVEEHQNHGLRLATIPATGVFMFKDANFL
jgi:hypothetical protein